MNERTAKTRDERGVVAIVVAMMALVIFGFAALVVDLGMARSVRASSQAAADASALAAANALYFRGSPLVPLAVLRAEQYAAANHGVKPAQWTSCVDPQRLAYFLPGKQCVSFDSVLKPTEVRVKMPSTRVASPFGAVFGVGSIDITAAAQAAVGSDASAECSVCILGDMSHDFQNGQLSVTGGHTVAFNGTLCVKNGGMVSSTSPGLVRVERTVGSSGDCSATSSQFPDGYTANAGVTEDPLAFLALPPAAQATLTTKLATTNACDPVLGGPGIYGSLNLPGSNCTLRPGLYVITGANHIAGGSTVVTARGVTLYFTCGTRTAPRACNSGESGGDLLMTGGSVLNHSGPTCAPPEIPILQCESIKGLSLIADRNNAASFSWRGNGGTVASSGTIYMASGTLDYRGNGSLDALDSLIVVKDLKNSGGTVLRATYTTPRNVAIPGGSLNLTE